MESFMYRIRRKRVGAKLRACINVRGSTNFIAIDPLRPQMLVLYSILRCPKIFLSIFKSQQKRSLHFQNLPIIQNLK